MIGKKLQGKRTVVDRRSRYYPESFKEIAKPPKKLRVVGDPEALVEGLAIVGARKATPYGLSCAKHFGELCAKNDVTVISGGALGCDSASQKACVDAGGKTIAFVASIDDVYPARNFDLFQKIINSGGAIVSENDWSVKNLPWMFRERNRLIAALAKATLICEAGIPSGTFSTADEAISANRDVLVIPGAITSKNSHGSNRLIYQGATPIIDDETFLDELHALFGCLRCKQISSNVLQENLSSEDKTMLEALNSSSLSVDELMFVARSFARDENLLAWTMTWVAKAKAAGWIAQYNDGTYGPCV